MKIIIQNPQAFSASAKKFPLGHGASLLSAGTLAGSELTIDDAKWQALQPAQKSIGLGDAIAAVATPIARALKLSCIDPVTKQLRPDSGCAQRKAALNRIVPKL